MDMHIVATSTGARTSRRRFLRHYVEMVIVMLVSMAVLGGIVSGIFALLGQSDVLDQAGVRAFVMATDMTVGMVIWMRFRRHGWPTTLEMAAAMVLPYLLLVGPYAAGLISGDVFLIAMHVLMLPFMFVVMLRRYEEYAHNHERHGATHPRPGSATGLSAVAVAWPHAGRAPRRTRSDPQ